MGLEYQQMPQPQLNSRRELQQITKKKLEEALFALLQYQKTTQFTSSTLPDHGDDLVAIQAKRLLPELLYFVGAAGEVCDACNGSGRKPKKE